MGDCEYGGQDHGEFHGVGARLSRLGINTHRLPHSAVLFTFYINRVSVVI